MSDIAHGSSSFLLKMIFLYFFSALICLVIIFLPAGSFQYWNGWLYLATLFIPAIFGLVYLYRSKPALLRRRMQYREKRHQQKLIITLSYPAFLLIFILPGVDFRFGWSHIPVWIVLLANGFVLAGYMFFFYTVHFNEFASRVVEIMPGQTVIQTGPYAIVRHPMYLAVLVMYTLTPIVLGSWWALIPALTVIPILVFRIIDEEKVLRKDLPGYVEYCQKIHYRILPGIW